MSEPHQLIGRIYGDKQELIKQRSRIIKPAQIYNDWHTMNSNPEYKAAVEFSIERAYSGKIFNELWSIYFNNSSFNGIEIDKYNETEKCWEFLLFFFSENYVDFITVLNGLRQTATQSSGTAAILPYMYGDGFNNAIILDITESTSKIHTTVNPEFKSWATDWLDSIIKSKQEMD